MPALHAPCSWRLWRLACGLQEPGADHGDDERYQGPGAAPRRSADDERYAHCGSATCGGMHACMRTCACRHDAAQPALCCLLATCQGCLSQHACLCQLYMSRRAQPHVHVCAAVPPADAGIMALSACCLSASGSRPLEWLCLIAAGRCVARCSVWRVRAWMVVGIGEQGRDDRRSVVANSTHCRPAPMCLRGHASLCLRCCALKLWLGADLTRSPNKRRVQWPLKETCAREAMPCPGCAGQPLIMH